MDVVPMLVEDTGKRIRSGNIFPIGRLEQCRFVEDHCRLTYSSGDNWPTGSGSLLPSCAGRCSRLVRVGADHPFLLFEHRRFWTKSPTDE
ncbi:MAG TPA: hypothetical protein DCE43_07155 [Planctomycetaceae bacterium]|nr:hypothetical protein [Planctomycetaceae bacterium]